MERKWDVRPNKHLGQHLSEQISKGRILTDLFLKNISKEMNVALVQSHIVVSIKPIHLTFTDCRHACFLKHGFARDLIVVQLQAAYRLKM